MATARLTIGAVFGAVNEAASTITTTLGTATKGINMVNKFVTDASDKQSMRSLVDMAEFQDLLIEEKSMESAIRKAEVDVFINASERNKELYEAAYNKYAALFVAKK